MPHQPSLFISHGAPTFAVEPGVAGDLLQGLGKRLPKPDAILVVSPHWKSHEFALTASPQPETLHDFGGFPAELYSLQYPAPGSPALAARVAELLAASGHAVRLDERRGLDHGVWVPLMHLYPQAELPVVQLSMPVGLDGQSSWQLGTILAPLRDEGVLIVGSGSLTHNLYEIGQADAPAVEYAREFVAWARQAVLEHDRAALVDYLRRAPHARRAHPSPDHYFPLLVAAAAGGPDAAVEVLDGGMRYGVLSMESYAFD